MQVSQPSGHRMSHTSAQQVRSLAALQPCSGPDQPGRQPPPGLLLLGLAWPCPDPGPRASLPSPFLLCGPSVFADSPSRGCLALRLLSLLLSFLPDALVLPRSASRAVLGHPRPHVWPQRGDRATPAMKLCSQGSSSARGWAGKQGDWQGPGSPRPELTDPFPGSEPHHVAPGHCRWG